MILNASAGACKLIEYYASVGRDDELVISIPKGGYAPIVFRITADGRLADQHLVHQDNLPAWLTDFRQATTR